VGFVDLKDLVVVFVDVVDLVDVLWTFCGTLVDF